MASSRTTGQGGSENDTVLAPVTYLPGVREAEARREALDLAEAEAERESLEAAEAEREALEAAESTSTWQADARRAENVTMHALTRRGQSRAEVAELLVRREIDLCVAEAELDRLESVGLIDDRALAVDLVDRLRTRKKLGASALRNELMRRKIDRDAIEEALAETDETDGDDMLIELARDRARRLGGLDRSTAERRLVDFLARKGHTGSAARDAARRALDGDDSDCDAGDEGDDDGPGHSGRGATVHRVQFR